MPNRYEPPFNEEQKRKHLTRGATRKLLASGELKREPCHDCGSDDVQVHHLDYSDPSAVLWLCRPHHDQRHPPDRTVAVMAPSELATALAPDLLERTEKLGLKPRADATARAYGSNWSRFEAWSMAHGLSSLPAEEPTIRAYLVTLDDDGKKLSSIALAYASIRSVHAEMGHPLPTFPAVNNTLKNIARKSSSAPKKKLPIMADTLKKISNSQGVGLFDVRDRALLLLGFAAALRRSELVALDVPDVVATGDGLEVTVRRGKTDQLGHGRTVGVPFGSHGSCPVRAFKEWIERTGISEGPIFRIVSSRGKVSTKRLHEQGVARAVKRAVFQMGLDPSAYAGHSLRSGLATSAAKAGKGLSSIMATTGHKSEAVAMGYIRHGSLFDDCAAEGLL